MPSSTSSSDPKSSPHDAGKRPAGRRVVFGLLGVILLTGLALGLMTLARYKVAMDAGSGELWGLWDCDPAYIVEGRPNLERIGCMVRVPDTPLKQALQGSREQIGAINIHSFVMGAQSTDPEAPHYDPEASEDEAPPHEVTLSPFWMQRFAVSVRQYEWCMVFGPCSEEAVATGGYFTYRPRSVIDVLLSYSADAERPVTGVTWEGAKTYCDWIGGRLPTEAEWEFAARGGQLQRRYPWGAEAPTCGHAVFGGGAGGHCDVNGPTSATEYRIYGQDRITNIQHMAGNTWEWTSDWYAEDAYKSAAERDPKGPSTGTGRVQRGGGWSDGDTEVLRSGYRAQMEPHLQMPDVGFRCAADGVDRHPYTTLVDFTGTRFSEWKGFGQMTRDGWKAGDGILRSPTSPGPHAVWRKGAALGDTLLSMRLYLTQRTGDSVAFIYGIQDGSNYYRAELHPAARVARIIRVLNGVEGVIAESSALNLSKRGWLTLNLDWRGGRHTFDLANQHLVSGDDSTWVVGDIGLQVSGHSAAIFDTVFTTP